MRVGDTVLVKDTGRRALVTGLLGEGHVQVEYLPDPAEDPVDRESPGDEELGGVYLEDALESLTRGE
jgi:hypothetical protein